MPFGRAVYIRAEGAEYTPTGRVVDEGTIANTIGGLLTTGGLTNHTSHFVAVARGWHHHQL